MQCTPFECTDGLRLHVRVEVLTLGSRGYSSGGSTLGSKEGGHYGYCDMLVLLLGMLGISSPLYCPFPLFLWSEDVHQRLGPDPGCWACLKDTCCGHRKSKKKLPEEVGRVIARDIAGGLLHMHRTRVTHQDVKPANILVALDQGPDGNAKLVARLCDLGEATRMLDHRGFG